MTVQRGDNILLPDLALRGAYFRFVDGTRARFLAGLLVERLLGLRLLDHEPKHDFERLAVCQIDLSLLLQQEIGHDSELLVHLIEKLCQPDRFIQLV